MIVDNRLFFTYFDEAADAEAAAAEVAEAEKLAKEVADGTNRTFTQDELNKILANDRRKHQDKITQTVKELEGLKQSKNLTEKEKAELEVRIGELKGEVQTKETIAAKEKENLKKDYEGKLKAATEERDTWEKRFKESLISRAIVDAAASEKAIAPAQIVAIIKEYGPRVVEEVDDNGKSIGKFTPKVKIEEKGQDDKTVTLDLTIAEAVKRMKENTERFGNLFETTASGGLGLKGGSGGRRTSANVKDMSPAEYREWRKSQGLQTGAR